MAELARELEVSPSVVRRWHHLIASGSSAAVGANQEVVPVSELRAAQQRIRDLERALYSWRVSRGRRPELLRPCAELRQRRSTL